MSDDLERILSVVPPHEVGDDFNDAVMRTIHRRRMLDAFVQIIAEPVVPVALALLAVIVWQYRTLALAVAAMAAMPVVTITLALALAPLILWAFWTATPAPPMQTRTAPPER